MQHKDHKVCRSVLFKKKLHCVSKKVPTFKLYVTLSNLNRFSKFLDCWKAHEICYKTHTILPHHFRYVATLPWEIENWNSLQIFSKYEKNCKHIVFCRLSPDRISSNTCPLRRHRPTTSRGLLLQQIRYSWIHVSRACSIVPLSTYKFKYKLVWVFHLIRVWKLLML